MSTSGWRRTPDPYLDWARTTGFAGHSALAGWPLDGYLPLLLKGPLTLAEGHRPRWHVPARYLGLKDPRFWTAWVPAAGVQALARLAAEYAMSLPMRGQPCQVAASDDEEAAPGLVIGVIDNGCAFLNRVFGHADDTGRSRFLGLWRQRPAEPAHADWRVPADFGYGLELSRERISDWHARSNGAEAEEAAYRSLGYPLDEQDRLSTMLHGTHVLDIAAGLPQDLPASASAKPLGKDDAAAAGLVFVELPQPLADDATGAALDVFILDAVHYILGRAGRHSRVIINLSVGAQAGPHDGGSLIEQALDALIRAEGGRLSICVAAGNGAQERWHADGTLRGRATRRDAQAAWRTVPGDATDSFLELWAFARNPAALTSLRVCLTAPDGRSIDAGLDDAGPALLLAQTAETDADADSPAGLQAMLDLRPAGVFDGRHRALALVSLAPTAGMRAGQPAGLWRLTVRTLPPAQGEPAPDCRVAIWLQRDTPGRSLDAMLQSQLDALSPNLQLDGAAATSHLAGGRRVITVGAARLSDGQPSAYSPRVGVDLWAAADESPEVLGLLCSGGLSGSAFRISGTSAASPLAARALADGLQPPMPQHGSLAAAGLHAADLALVRPDNVAAPPADNSGVVQG
jgi:hypothetical protein